MEYKPNSYLLNWNNSLLTAITAEVTKWDRNGVPISWAIRRGTVCIDKEIKRFIVEQMPSSRTDEFFKNCRFETDKECFDFWDKYGVDISERGNR